MNKNIKLFSVGAIGLIFLIVTFVIFFLGNANTEKTSLDWISLIFTIVSEFVLFVSVIYIISQSSSSSKMIIRIGIISTLLIYWVSTVIIALLKNVFVDNIKGFIILNIVIIAVVATISILLYVASLKITSTDNKTIYDKSFMEDLEKRVFALKSRQYNDNLLNKIYESIKYSDKIGSSSVDSKISSLICMLEDKSKDQDDIGGTVEEVLSLLKQRSVEISQLKRGEF